MDIVPVSRGDRDAGQTWIASVRTERAKNARQGRDVIAITKISAARQNPTSDQAHICSARLVPHSEISSEIVLNSRNCYC